MVASSVTSRVILGRKNQKVFNYMKTKLTEKLIDTLNATTKDLLVWDTVVSGFGLRCRVQGTKSFIVKYRNGKRQRWVALGRADHLKVEKARDMARVMLGSIANGDDPAQKRETQRIASTMKELTELFLENAAVKNKPRTSDEYKRIINKFIIPELGQFHVADVERTDIARLHQKLKDIPYQANRILAVLSSMFTLAEKLGVTQNKANPCRHIDKYRERKVERYLNKEEFMRLEKVLVLAENENWGTPYMWAAIRLLILTGARLSEILTLKWEHVDFQRQMLHLPDSKTGKKTIFLNAPAIAVLQNIKRLVSNPYVIIGRKDGEHLINLEKPWRMIRKKAKLPDVRIHDLRHSFASVAAASGMSLPMIGALLGHTHTSTTARYAHLAAPLLGEASNTIGNAIMKSVSGTPAKRLPKA